MGGRQEESELGGGKEYSEITSSGHRVTVTCINSQHQWSLVQVLQQDRDGQYTQQMCS